MTEAGCGARAFEHGLEREEQYLRVMKAKTIHIVWHNTEPVWSLDFHPSGLLATGGGDKEIKVCATC